MIPAVSFPEYKTRGQLLRQDLTSSTIGPPTTRESSDVHHRLNVSKPLKPSTIDCIETGGIMEYKQISFQTLKVYDVF